MVRDLQLAIRRFRFKPAYTALLIVILGVGIGAATAVFSVVDQTILRPPPFAHPDRLVEVLDLYRSAGARSTSLTPQKIAGWQAQPSLFEGFEGYASREFDLTGDELEPERVRGLIVSNGLLGMLGVHRHSGGDSPQTTAERAASASRSSVKGCGGAGLAAVRTYLGRASRSATNSTRSSGSCRGASGSQARAKICGCRSMSGQAGASPLPPTLRGHRPGSHLASIRGRNSRWPTRSRRGCRRKRRCLPNPTGIFTSRAKKVAHVADDDRDRALRAARRRGVRAPHHVREHREPLSVADRRSSARDGRSRGDRRVPTASVS